LGISESRLPRDAHRQSAGDRPMPTALPVTDFFHARLSQPALVSFRQRTTSFRVIKFLCLFSGNLCVSGV
jgi:hypothetical protein